MKKVKSVTTITNSSGTRTIISGVWTTKCGRIPKVGDVFWYRSKYDDAIVEGVVKSCLGSKIVSTNNVQYDLGDIELKPISVIREEKLNDILNDEQE